MNFDEVPLSMREARQEMLLALASSRQANASQHCRRAANLLNDAISSIQAHPAADYDWSLLRAEHH